MPAFQNDVVLPFEQFNENKKRLSRENNKNRNLSNIDEKRYYASHNQRAQ